MSSPPGLEGSIPAEQLALLRFMLRSDQRCRSVAAELPERPRVTRSGKPQSRSVVPAPGDSTKHSPSLARCPSKELRGELRRLKCLLFGEVFTATFDICTDWAGGGCLDIYTTDFSGKDCAGETWQRLLTLTRAALAAPFLSSSCRRFQHWLAPPRPTPGPDGDLLVDKLSELWHFFPNTL